MLTDYAREEKAYFRAYPYLEMAAREKINMPVAREILTVKLTPKKIPQEIITIASHTPPESLKKARPIQHHKTLQKTKEPQGNKTITPSSQVLGPKPDKIKKSPEENWRHAAKQGYDAYDETDYKTAITYFERALKVSPDNPDLRLQLAYAYKKTGQNSQAARNFRSAIDQYDGEAAPFTLRREVEQLENRFEMNGYVIYRDESSDTRQLGADLTQSQAGIELSYQPEKIRFDKGRKFQIYARFLSGMEQDRLELDPDSYQAGIGLRLKPLSGHNLVLSAERLLKVGTFARNDWMLRAGYSRDHGTDYQEDQTRWWSYSLYLDAALIDPADPDIFLTSQVTGGYSMTVAQGLVLQPRVSALTSWQKDSFHEASLIEAGPGLNIRYYFNDTKYEAFRSYIDLTVEYRLKLSGNSIGGSGPVISLLLHF